MSWPPAKFSRFDQLYLDGDTLIFRNDPASPYKDQITEWNDEILAFDAEGEVISAVANFTTDGRIVGEITFGLGGAINAHSPAEMAAQIDSYVDGFSG